jgi:beta-galactosidase
MKDAEFLFGVQYYRAPTPEQEDWESDLANIRSNGFRDIKLWVQWRWTHRAEDEFYFADTDRLMDLAQQNGLRVTINVVFDIAPKWFLDQYPESAMVLANGQPVESAAVCYLTACSVEACNYLKCLELCTEVVVSR